MDKHFTEEIKDQESDAIAAITDIRNTEGACVGDLNNALQHVIDYAMECKAELVSSPIVVSAVAALILFN